MLQALFSAQTGQVFKDESNAKRICPLNTVYIGTFDSDMLQKDKEYLFAVGKCMALTWLNNKYPKAKDETPSIPSVENSSVVPSLEISSLDSSSTSPRSPESSKLAAEKQHFVSEQLPTNGEHKKADDDKSVKSAAGSKRLSRLRLG